MLEQIKTRTDQHSFPLGFVCVEHSKISKYLEAQKSLHAKMKRKNKIK